MDWLKLIGLSGVLFMFLEILAAKIAKLKKWVTRVIIFIIMAGACLGLAIVAPVITVTKAAVLLNAIIYFITEYFIYLFLRNELKLSLKKMILSKFGGDEGKL